MGQKIAVFERSRSKGLIQVVRKLEKRELRNQNFTATLNTLTITADEHIPNANTLVKLNLFNTIDRDVYNYAGTNL